MVTQFLSRGYEFVREVCEDSKLLESVSGISTLMSEVDLDNCVESDDDF